MVYDALSLVVRERINKQNADLLPSVTRGRQVSYPAYPASTRMVRAIISIMPVAIVATYRGNRRAGQRGSYYA